ncbi:DUF4129 domain-containing protein [Paenibacillus motobuensis]|uniref:DUF4129 domain-containing protein n=1 Tax=Paenibacillus TaxID=44249 RepID=UPI00203D3BD6|nr:MULTISPECIES: DUF4129 domain-containing protein [Paenibacillus]MCM3042770.1 DUF4129 domain-containing protein [Paenibacillus lutimineralis]MCM3649874.1 DUF4129 domain-containing protein [Paenibacillus motobuensis]
MENKGNAYITKTLKLCLSCLGEMVVLMPIYLAGISVLSPQYLPLALLVILPLVSFLGVAIRSYVPVLWKKLGAAVLIGAACAAVFLLSGAAGFTPLIGLCAGVFALQGMTATDRAGMAKLYWYGVALYFVAGIVYSRVALLHGELGLITWFGVGCLAIALFTTNFEYLRYTTLSDHSRLPRGLRRHNTLFIVIILGLVVLLAAGAGRWIGNLLLKFVRYIFAWLTRSSGEPKELEPEEVQEPPAMFFPGEVQKPGLLSQILDILFYVIGGAVIAAMIGFALYWLYKNAGGFWKRSIDRLLALLRRQDLAGENKGYRDEEVSIFSWEERKQRLGNWRTVLSRFGRRQERYEDMHSNQERVRFLYRRFLLTRRSEGCEIKPELTPLEMARDMQRHNDNEKKHQRGKPGQAAHKVAIEPLILLYYRVRYGGQEPDDEEVADIKRMLNL